MRKLKTACLNTKKQVIDCLILNERQCGHSAAGWESENKTRTCAVIKQVKRWSCAKGDVVNGTG